jgi:hypothetical protein
MINQYAYRVTEHKKPLLDIAFRELSSSNKDIKPFMIGLNPKSIEDYIMENYNDIVDNIGVDHYEKATVRFFDLIGKYQLCRHCLESKDTKGFTLVGKGVQDIADRERLTKGFDIFTPNYSFHNKLVAQGNFLDTMYLYKGHIIGLPYENLAEVLGSTPLVKV